MVCFFKRPPGFRAGLALALAASAATVGTAAAAEAAAFAPSATLAARVPHVSGTDLGPLSASARVRVAFILNYRHPSELEAFVRSTADPDSPEFGHFLTPAQFEAAFAPSNADYNRVARTLAASGFTIEVAPNRSIVDASAPARVAERFFATQFHAVRQSGAGVRYANASPAYVPASIRDVTFGVTGLNNLIFVKTAIARGARRIDLALKPPLQGPDTGLGPYAFATAYKLPVQFAKPGGGTYDGKGHAAGIAIDSDLAAPGDLAAFLNYFGVKQTGPALKRILVDGGPVPLSNFDSGETNLDAETISSLAPGAATYLYLMPDLSTAHIVDTYAKVVADDKIDALNSSFGGCELADNLSTLSDHIALQGAAEGITFAASSGDSGASTCFGFVDNYLGVSAPASAPHFTAVGGTSLFVTQAGAYRFEFGWTGSGGGVSTLFPVPAYQKGIAHVIAAGRNVPDVSFDANPGTGAAFYYNGAFVGPLGGTSLASPIFVAYLTERNQVAGKRSGAVNTALYAAFKKNGYGTLFHDVTIGNNFLFGTTSGIPGYFNGPGYDDVTGIGSPIGTPNAK